MKQACSGSLLAAPMFLDLVIHANREHLMSFNVSFEIANYIHCKIVHKLGEKLDFDEFMFYNLDHARLEDHLRNFLIVRILDSGIMAKRPSYYFSLDDEELLLARLREYNGGKFIHKIKVLLKNYKQDFDNIQVPGISVTTFPQAVWPVEFANPLKH